MMARLLFCAPVVALAFGLSGCVVFKVEPKAKQVGPETVRVNLKICASGPDTGTCPDLGNSDTDADEDRVNVVLVGLRVPEGSGAERRPQSDELELLRSRQFARVLNDEAPTPVGYEWTAYRSAAVETDPEDTAKITIDVDLPEGFDGGRFKYRPTVGYFEPDDERPEDSPIVCGTALFDRDVNDEGDRVCIDSPTPDETAAHLKLALG